MTSNLSIKQTLCQLFGRLPGGANSILTAQKGNQLWITFNRPTRANAFTPDMYHRLSAIISQANHDDRIKFIILTGKGGNFCSGNDLQNFFTVMEWDISIAQASKASSDFLIGLNESIINSKKPIFAIVEGKSIGFGFTVQALLDRVFVVEGSLYEAPMVKLAQGPEMCASFTFPRIFGQKVAEDLIMKGIQVNSTFLQKYDFFTVCKSRTDAEQHLQQHIAQLDALDWKSFLSTRKLFRDIDRPSLIEITRKELENLYQRWIDPDLPAKIIQAMSKANKSKTKPRL